jgi:hypothetical protein
MVPQTLKVDETRTGLWTLKWFLIGRCGVSGSCSSAHRGVVKKMNCRMNFPQCIFGMADDFSRMTFAKAFYTMLVTWRNASKLFS